MPRAACWAPVTAKRYLDLATKVREDGARASCSTSPRTRTESHDDLRPSLLVMVSVADIDTWMCAVACVVCVSAGCMLQEGLDDMFSSDLTGEELGQRLGHVSVPTLLAFSAAGNEGRQPLLFYLTPWVKRENSHSSTPVPQPPILFIETDAPALIPACLSQTSTCRRRWTCLRSPRGCERPSPAGRARRCTWRAPSTR